MRRVDIIPFSATGLPTPPGVLLSFIQLAPETGAPVYRKAQAKGKPPQAGSLVPGRGGPGQGAAERQGVVSWLLWDFLVGFGGSRRSGDEKHSFSPSRWRARRPGAILDETIRIELPRVRSIAVAEQGNVVWGGASVFRWSQDDGSRNKCRGKCRSAVDAARRR